MSSGGKQLKKGLLFQSNRSLELVETVLTTNHAGPMSKDLGAMLSSIAGVEGMETILRLKMIAFRAVNQTQE
jgi:hypothetical protein